MNIVVVGGGKVGSTLVEQLSNEEHDITWMSIRRSSPISQTAMISSPSAVTALLTLSRFRQVSKRLT